MNLSGRARRFKQDDDINTDYIISGRYKFKIQDPLELAKHVMEDLDENFYNRREDGDFIVAGKNFGCGSSREQAPMAIKYAGINAVIAKSFARIFYRNAFNIGLLLIECDTSAIKDSDKLELDLDAGILKNLTREIEQKINPLPRAMQRLLKDGGLVEHFKKHGSFKID
ncbi:3-isopropylmalate dehydratase small subunit [Candidatus Desantisbacteria bacterium]|nr:3-isopropylmalate dehydratase small subunit [Candidatus Desantisbacteria bacterium]